MSNIAMKLEFYVYIVDRIHYQMLRKTLKDRNSVFSHDAISFKDFLKPLSETISKLLYFYFKPSIIYVNFEHKTNKRF